MTPKQLERAVLPSVLRVPRKVGGVVKPSWVLFQHKSMLIHFAVCLAHQEISTGIFSFQPGSCFGFRNLDFHSVLDMGVISIS